MVVTTKRGIMTFSKYQVTIIKVGVGTNLLSVLGGVRVRGYQASGPTSLK